MTYQIVTFYEFKKLSGLKAIKSALKSGMEEKSIFGTFIIANEGFNSTICGTTKDLAKFIPRVEHIFDTKIEFKSSFHEEMAFRRRKVKIKKEIVTLRKEVDIEKGLGTHVEAQNWNEILEDPETVVIDARNEYEYKVGSFNGAVNPKTSSFNELPDFVEQNLDPNKDNKVAIFCTGGIRCEKFAPYLKEQGFKDVYQLKGGILKYLEEVSDEKSLWEGECFVFDERITVDSNLEKGSAEDFSLEAKTK